MTIKLYGTEASAVYRATLLTVEALGLEVEQIEVNTLLGDQLKPEYFQINPLHTIPCIQDGDFTIWDSHAINCYLVDKYAKDDSLYPKDLQKRAVVSQRLYFDCGVLFPKLVAIFVTLIKEEAKTVRQDLADSLVEAYTSLETLLEKSTYVAGDHVTIADFSIVTTVTTAQLLVPVVPKKFPKIAEWLTKMQELSYYAQGNQAGLDVLTVGLKTKLGWTVS